MSSLPETPSIPSPALFSLVGDNVLITGATRGIGAACAIALAQAGASVICIVVRPPTLQESNEGKVQESFEENPPEIISRILVASPNTKREQLKIVACDLGDMAQVKVLFDKALALMPNNAINILVNCAGIQRRAKSIDFPEDDWDAGLEAFSRDLAAADTRRQ